MKAEVYLNVVKAKKRCLLRATRPYVVKPPTLECFEDVGQNIFQIEYGENVCLDQCWHGEKKCKKTLIPTLLIFLRPLLQTHNFFRSKNNV